MAARRKHLTKRCDGSHKRPRINEGERTEQEESGVGVGGLTALAAQRVEGTVNEVGIHATRKLHFDTKSIPQTKRLFPQRSRKQTVRF
jgi:hypothetical protein